MKNINQAEPLFEHNGNFLLGALPKHEQWKVRNNIELAEFHAGQVLVDSRRPIECVYFPITNTIALYRLHERGELKKVAAVGREGMTVVPPRAGANLAAVRLQVQRDGLAYSMSVAALRRCMDHSETLCLVVSLYAQALMAQIADTETCNRNPSIYNNSPRRIQIEDEGIQRVGCR
jgi:hypothetical protein